MEEADYLAMFAHYSGSWKPQLNFERLWAPLLDAKVSGMHNRFKDEADVLPFILKTRISHHIQPLLPTQSQSNH